MSVDQKVIAAISSAIGFYLQAEQEALLARCGPHTRRSS